MLPMLDPFTIAAAGLLSHRVRPWCVAKSGLLKVPHLILNFACPVGDERIMHALAAIEKSELVEFELWNSNCQDAWGSSAGFPAPPVESHDHFSICLGWLLGTFTKLHRGCPRILKLGHGM